MPMSATGNRPRRVEGRRRSAVTLIELMIVLVVMGIAAGLIVPRMANSIDRRTVADAAARFAHTARAVRDLAISRQRNTGLRFEGEQRLCLPVMQPEPDDASGNSRQMQTVQASWLKVQRWPEAIRTIEFKSLDTQSGQADRDTVIFYPNGSSSGALIRLSGERQVYEIIIRPHNGQVDYGLTGSLELESYQYDLGD